VGINGSRGIDERCRVDDGGGRCAERSTARQHDAETVPRVIFALILSYCRLQIVKDHCNELSGWGRRGSRENPLNFDSGFGKQRFDIRKETVIQSLHRLLDEFIARMTFRALSHELTDGVLHVEFKSFLKILSPPILHSPWSKLSPYRSTECTK